MSSPLYRDYSQWILAMEPRMGFSRISRSQFRKLAGLVLGLFVFGAGLLVSRMAVIKVGYQIVELRQERDRLMAERKQNERRLRELESLAHAELYARKEMGMVDINPNQVITLEDPASSGVGRAWRAVFGD